MKISEVFIIQVIVTPPNDWLEASYLTHHAQTNFYSSSKNVSLMSDDKYCRTFITRNFRRKKLFIRKIFPLNKIQQVKRLSLLSLKVFPIRKVVSLSFCFSVLSQ